MADVDSQAISHAPRGGAHGCATAVFSAAVFLSAALLFWIEPLFSKMVLPVLGGTSAVWSVAMVVFQGLMLAGYVYAHLLTRYLPIRLALLAHLLLLAAAILFLPIAIAGGFETPPQASPSLWLMGLFLASIGLPFFALAANAPLLQAWYARGDARNAYLLYRASNLGSFLVLLSYPVLIERSVGLAAQSRLWSGGYVFLILAILASGLLALRAPESKTAASNPVAVASPWHDRLSWAVLGFIPSGLLIAVTAHIATDVASGPYIWIVPLALYLLTFVFAFSDRPLLPAKAMLAVQPFTTALLVVLFFWSAQINWAFSLAGHLLAFFVAAMVCQHELYRRRPAQENLTQFYVWMSLGGVLGGIFVALAAPHLFSTVFEYPLLVLAALLIRPNVRQTPRTVWIKDLMLVAGAGIVYAAASIRFCCDAARRRIIWGLFGHELRCRFAEQAAIGHPVRDAVGPVLQADQRRILAHVEGMAAGRVHVQLDRRARGAIGGQQVDEWRRATGIVIRRGEQHRRRILRHPLFSLERPGKFEDREIRPGRNPVDRIAFAAWRGRRAQRRHSRELAACRKAHDADAIRIDPKLARARPHQAHCPLGIGPGVVE